MQEIEANNLVNILIVGGGVGGCTAAKAACEAGLNVILTEETDWIGGQFTSQATQPQSGEGSIYLSVLSYSKNLCYFSHFII